MLLHFVLVALCSIVCNYVKCLMEPVQFDRTVLVTMETEIEDWYLARLDTS